MSIKFPNSHFVADASVRGRLYDLGAYPGLLLNDSSSLVIGEVYEVDDEILQELDDYEASSNYLRKEVETTAGNQSQTCWIYVPEHDAQYYSDRTLITSGDWMEYARMRTG